MPLHLIRQDITLMQVDAIVNASNHRLLDGGGVNGAIHRAAGPGLLAECQTLGGCQTGEAKFTSAYRLPCKYVIHTVGPVWQGGTHNEPALLASCYRKSLALAQELGCESIAFPLISSGVFGYPRELAIKTATEAIGAFLLESDADLHVYLVLFNREAVLSGSKLFADIRQYIDDRYVQTHADVYRENLRAQRMQQEACWMSESCAAPPAPMSAPPKKKPFFPKRRMPAATLEEALRHIDESFSEMVLRRIREKGMKNADCYKKANLDKKHFSKIANDPHYRPKKTTVLALAVALEMDLTETRELLMKAGMALSPSDKFDIIVEFFIRNGVYDIFVINEALFDYDQPLLGAVG